MICTGRHRPHCQCQVTGDATWLDKSSTLGLRHFDQLGLVRGEGNNLSWSDSFNRYGIAIPRHEVTLEHSLLYPFSARIAS